MSRAGARPAWAALLAVFAHCGCVQLAERDERMRPAWAEAARDAPRMRAEPKPLTRPLVVLGGYRAPPFHASGLAAGLVQLTSGRSADVLVLSFPLSSDLDSMAARVIRAVERRWPSKEPDRTVAVDVVGISMGGILARWAAVPPERRHRPDQPAASGGDARKRLRIARLFTLSSPHQGAVLADWIAPDRAARDMRRGSSLLGVLDGELPGAEYELICYAQSGDIVVGGRRSAPAGRPVVRTAGTLLFSHLAIVFNPIVRADIARRLRGERSLIEVEAPPGGKAGPGATASSSSARSAS